MRTIKEKVLLNFGSTVLPMTAGLLAIPVLIEEMGVERFGLLSIAWMIVGYFGLLDMGLGRALTQRIATNLGIGKEGEIKPLIYFSLKILLFLSITISFLLFCSSEYIVFNIFDITDIYEEETKYSMYWVALTIPFVMLSTALFGVLEGFQYFGWIALIRLPLNVLMFLAPILAFDLENNLEVVMFSLFLVRLVAFLVLLVVVYWQVLAFKNSPISKAERKALLSFGGWITLSNLVSPIMVYFDRFYIASVLGALLVAYYTTPLDLLVKATLIPFSIIGVMFSYFASNWQTNREKVIDAYKKTLFIVFFMMLAFLVVVYFGAKEGLAIWIDEDFASKSYVLTQIIALGVFFNSLAMVPFALVQGVGRSDLTAKLHLLELPVFIVLLFFGVQKYGLMGAAWAWTVRVILDFLLLKLAAYYILRNNKYA
ncbi:flippase [Halomonas citrativorans]|uniref:Flippase n=1 Tax=Halomonas citrativorans TaxID=2742612 RepID=A0ABR9FDA4_9GAMM|nr:flippase [Halomonas citrativorans]MBE0404477.1 flippase [Halomonas citrativorans]